jgi:hypothetical protein
MQSYGRTGDGLFGAPQSVLDILKAPHVQAHKLEVYFVKMRKAEPLKNDPESRGYHVRHTMQEMYDSRYSETSK